jgi:ADP-heptose:LPS heptosyltransferase
LWELIGEAELVVCSDTGVLHLAYGIGTPAVSLFGSGIEPKWAPPGRHYRSINKHLSCSPCTLFGETPPCPIGIACMAAITVEEVQRAAWELLEGFK